MEWNATDGIELDIPVVRVIELANNCSAAVRNYLQYHLLKKSSQYDDDLYHNLHSKLKKIVLKMNDANSFVAGTVLVIPFLEKLKSGYDTSGFEQDRAYGI